MRHGKGKMTWPDGASYDGLWQCNAATKEGKFIHVNGDVYEGGWAANNLMTGFGVYKHANGAEYRGTWLHGQMHGKGHESWPEGASYAGEYL